MSGNDNIFLGSGASLTLVPEVDLWMPIDHSSQTSTVLTTTSAYYGNFELVPNLYVGREVDIIKNADNTVQSTHLISANTSRTITLATAKTYTMVSTDYIVIKGYGAPCPGVKSGTNATLNADNFLGLVESASFPQVEQEMKQMNLALGGTRNITHQYRGIRTASGGNIGYVMHSGAMLYYALGKVLDITCDTSGANPSTALLAHDSAGQVYLDTGSHGAAVQANHTEPVETGPLFVRTKRASNILVPPIPDHLGTPSNYNRVLRSNINGSTLNMDAGITYNIHEGNTSDLPSFALEQNIAKDPATLTTDSTGISNAESTNFVRIARGNRINTLTITASEGEEMKMTADLNTRAVESIRHLDVASDANLTGYIGRHGITDNAQLFNWEGNEGTTMFAPFFFSAGSFSILGQQFMKMNSLTLTINNNLMDKRYMGNHRDMKEALAAQRTYELSFTAVVTDDVLFEEIFNEAENTGASQEINLTFLKDNGESIILKFQDYFIDTANWTIPDDKGPVTVEATVRPRNLKPSSGAGVGGCLVKTHYVLQG